VGYTYGLYPYVRSINAYNEKNPLESGVGMILR
jgi:hypothetical protein